MPDCRNCQRPMRRLCDDLSELIGIDYQRLGLSPPGDQAYWLKEVERDDQAQQHLQEVCAQALRRQGSSAQETRPASPDLTNVVQITEFLRRRHAEK